MSNTESLQQQFKTVHLVVDMQHMWADQLSPEDQASLPSAIEAFVKATHKTAPPLYIESIDDDMYRADVDHNQYKSVIEHSPASLGRKTKTVSSAFQHGEYSDLNGKLKKLGVEEIIISGGFTRRCVWETAVDAVKCGYDVTILEDLCRDSVHLKRGIDCTELTIINGAAHYPAVTEELCAAQGITLGHSSQYNNSGNFGGAAQSVAALRR